SGVEDPPECPLDPSRDLRPQQGALGAGRHSAGGLGRGHMIQRGKRDILGVMVDVVDYESAVDQIVHAAKERRGFAATALAVHGVMTGALDPEQRFRLNEFDLVVPDGQPVRWALNLLHSAQLTDRVYGPTLMLA